MATRLNHKILFIHCPRGFLAFSYTIDGPLRLVTIMAVGRVTHDEWEAAMRLIFADSRFKPGFDFLSDRRSVEEPPDGDSVRRGVAFFEIERRLLGHCRWAQVVAGSAGYGMGRMSEALTADTGVRLRVFTDMAEARKWLTPVATE